MIRPNRSLLVRSFCVIIVCGLRIGRFLSWTDPMLLGFAYERICHRKGYRLCIKSDKVPKISRSHLLLDASMYVCLELNVYSFALVYC